MAGLRNRYRPLVVDDTPVALGFLTVGDASVCTNPLYGRGCSLALVHAFGLADALREHGDDHESLARVFAGVHRARAGAVVPHRGVPGRAGAHASRGRGASARGSARVRAGASSATACCPRCGPRRSSSARSSAGSTCLSTPDALMSDPEIVNEVLAAYQNRESHPAPEPLGPPDRAAFVARASVGEQGAAGRGRCRRSAGGSRSRASARTRRGCRSPRGATPGRRGTRSTRRRRTRRLRHRSRT